LQPSLFVRQLTSSCHHCCHQVPCSNSVASSQAWCSSMADKGRPIVGWFGCCRARVLGLILLVSW
jgi:hypothetical protein